MSVTKLAFARGVGNYLQRTGTTQIPTEGLLKQACAVASHAISVEPSAQAVPYEQVFKVAQHLVAFNETLTQLGKTAAHVQPATIDRDSQTAYGDMITTLVKRAMQESSIITGGPSLPNTIANSVDAAAVLESHRPDNYAVVGQGNANFTDVPSAAVVGLETPHPLAPWGVGGAASNSVVEVSKNASIQNTLRKLAMGESSTITGANPNQGNTQQLSPSSEGMLDISQRPPDYALVGLGNANFDGTPANAVTGMEAPHPDQPAHSGVATNSVVEATKNAQWHQHFNAVASLVGPQLPSAMPMEHKVAAVKQCMALEPIAQQQYLQKLASQYAPQSTVGSLLNSLNQLHH
ncbi:MAG TPA: hypothetical protein VFH61_13935 [Thermoleophilia bacterium]|nr:hypothetical protein [Thermoleophilia bacterium]